MKNLFAILSAFLLLYLIPLQDISAQFTNSSFANRFNYVTGTGGTSNPLGIAATDLDNDGKEDVVIANTGNNTISVFRNTSVLSGIGAASFAAKVDFALPVSPTWVFFADLNGDGKTDVIVGMGSGTVFSIYHNNSTTGNIILNNRVDITANNYPLYVAAGDLDNDGKIDLVTANFNSNNISVFRNTTTGSIINFATKIDFNAGTGTSSVAIGDFNSDGKPDIATTNFNANTISIFRNNTNTPGNIQLLNSNTLTAASVPHYIKVVDIDGDRKVDILCSNYTGNNFSIFRNTSLSFGINFAGRVDVATGTGTSNPRGNEVMDMDDDGRPDIVVVNNANQTISVFRNQTAPGTINVASFSNRIDLAVGLSARDVFISDIDNNGRPDILTSDNGSNTFGIHRNQILYPVEPNFAASGLTFSAVNNNSMTVSFTKGNGQRRIVLARASNPISSSPIDSTIYFANSTFALGSQIGSGNYVVYSDTGNTFSLTGLNSNTTYYFSVYEYNGSKGFANFNTSSFLSGTRATANLTYYYSKATGNLNSLATWGTASDGTGTSPTSFSSPNSYYFIRNNFTPTISANLTITGGNTALILGDGTTNYYLSIPSGTSITADTFLATTNSTVAISGNLAGNVIVFENFTTAQFVGSNPQIIPSASYHDFIIAGANKTLGGNVIVRNNLGMLTSIDLNSNTLMLGTSTSNLGLLNWSTGTLFNGSFKRWFAAATNFGNTGLFPIGTFSYYRPALVEFTTAPTSGGAITATFVPSNPTTIGLPLFDFSVSPIIIINKLGQNGYWDMTPDNLTGGQYTGTFVAANFDYVWWYPDLRLARRNSSSSAWVITGTAQITTGNNLVPALSRTGMNVFGQFAVGGDASINPLPVKLISLEGKLLDENSIKLIWSTASEVNNKAFILSRSYNSKDWDVVGKIAGNNNANKISSYFHLDQEFDATNKNVFYKLEQLDFDGTQKDLGMIKVSLQKSDDEIYVYPNPVSDKLYVISKATNGNYEISDVSGKVVLKGILNNAEKTIETECLKAGIYFINIDGTRLKITKQ